MPYVDQASRARIKELGLTGIKTWGDVNYFITLRILEIWRAKKRYATVHDLARRCTQAFDMLDPIEKVIVVKSMDLYEDKSYAQDFNAAHMNAYLEFYIRVGRKYEEKVINKNGDVYTDEDFNF